MLAADSTIIRIKQSGRDQPHESQFDFQSNVDSRKELHDEDTKEKVLIHQNDRYTNQKITKGLFDDSNDDLFTSSPGIKESKSRKTPTIPNTSHEESEFKGESSVVRKGSRKKLPALETLRRAGSIGLAHEEQIAKVGNKSLSSPEVLRKKTNYKPGQVKNIVYFIKGAVPKYKKLHTILKRDREGLKRFFPLFDISFAFDSSYIMSSKRTPCFSTSTYFMTTKKQGQQSTITDLGTVQSNFSGSIYNVFDDYHEIIATIVYDGEIYCTAKPRQIEVYTVSPYYVYSQLAGINDDKNNPKNLKQLYDVQDNAQNKRILKFITKKPAWNAQRNCWELNFHGRLKMSSVKNMILVDVDSQDFEVMLLAKFDDNLFNLEVNHPFSPRIAMAVANSCFDFKWKCQ